MRSQARMTANETAGSRKSMLPLSTDVIRSAPRMWMSVESFEYVPRGGHASIVRLVAALDPALNVPARADLMTAAEVEPGDAQSQEWPLPLGAGMPEPFAAHASHKTRRRGPQMPHHGFEYAIERSDSGLIWQVSFQVPLAIVECRGTHYE